MALTIPGSDNDDDDKWLSNDDIGSVDKPASPLIESSNKYLAYGQGLKNQERLDQYMAIPEEESTKDYFAYGQELRKTNVENLKNSLKIASLADAEQAAAIQELSTKTGLPPSYIQGNVSEVKRMVTLTALDADKLAQQSPILSKQLKDPLFAAIAYDDIEHLSGIEEAAHGVSTFFRSAGSALYAVPQGTLSLIGSVPDSVDSIMSAAGIDTSEKGSLAHLPKFIGEKFGAGSQSIADRREQIKGDLSRYESDRWLTWEDVFSGIESTGMMLPGTVATMLTGNPTFMLGSAGLSMFGESYPSALEEGLPQPTAMMYALTQSTTEMAFEMLPISRLLRDTKIGSGFFKTFYNQLLVEIPQEQLTTIAQEYTDFMVLPSQANMTFGDYLKARPESAWHTLISTLVGVAGQTSVMHYGNKLLNRVANAGIKVDPALKAMMEDEERAREALRSNEKIVELVSKIQESKMLELSPDSLKGFVRELFQSEVDGEVSDVIVYSQDIAQYAEEQGIAIEDISPLFADQVQEATENQGYFSFKVEDYLTDIALGEHGDAINQLLRVNENAMSVQEAGTWNEERNQKLMDQADAIISSMANEDKVAGDEVFNEVVRQLENIGVPRDDANQSAALYKAFFTIMGDRAGIDAKQLFDRYNLELQRNLPEGTVKANDTDTLSDLVDSILDTEISTKATVKKQTEEANALVEKVKELKKVKEAAKDAASDFSDGDGTTIPTQEELNAYYEENVDPLEVAQLEAEIEYERLIQSRKLDNEESINTYQKAINQNLKKIAKIQGVDFVEEAAPGVVESTETTVEQIEEIRAYLASEMGVDLAATDKAELLDLIRNNFYDPQGRTLDQAAFHGTGFADVIEKFSTDFIGTGEGAVSFGWGLYFASQKEVADWYRRKLTQQKGTKITITKADGSVIEDLTKDDQYIGEYRDIYQRWLLADQNIEAAIDTAAKQLAQKRELKAMFMPFIEDMDMLRDGVLPEGFRYGQGTDSLSERVVLEWKPPEYLASQRFRLRDLTNPEDRGWEPFATKLGTAKKDTARQLQESIEGYMTMMNIDQDVLPAETFYNKISEFSDSTWTITELKPGAVYEVDLKPAEEDYLVWDAQLNDQSDKVIKVINKLIKKYKLGEAGGLEYGRDVYRQVGYIEEVFTDMTSTTNFPEKEAVSKFLLREGVRGIKFADGNTRQNMYEDGSEVDWNYVIFDDADVEITQTFNQSAVKNEEILEYVGTNEPLKNMLEYVHIDDLMALRGEYGATYNDSAWSNLKQSIQDEGGLTDPIRIQVDRFSRTAEIGEGNHRITAAKELGYKWLPTSTNIFDEENVRKNKRTDIIPSKDNEVFHPSHDAEGKQRKEWRPSHGKPSQYLSDIRTLPLEREFFQSAQEPTLEEFVAQKQGNNVLEDNQWRNWKPKLDKKGKPLGSPENIKNTSDLTKLRKFLRQLLEEGLSGRYWYENSANAVMKIVNNDIVEAEKFIQLLAIYSAHTEVFVNTMSAVKAYSMWKNGVAEDEFHVATSDMDKKATDLLYHNKDWDGRKTGTFYKNLMYEIVRTNPGALNQLRLDEDLVNDINKGATIDLWMYRAFGYRQESGGDDKGSGKYSFSENETRRLTARLNSNLKPGEDRWTPHQVQAAIWAAMRTRYNFAEVKSETTRKSINKKLTKVIKKDGKKKLTFPAKGKDKDDHYAIWRKEAMKVPSENVTKVAESTDASFAIQLNKLTKNVTWETIPSPSLAHDILNASPELQKRFTQEAKQIMLDENGNDMFAALLGVPLNYDSVSRGAYEEDISSNVVTRLIPIKPAGDFTREDVRLYAQALQYIFKQDAVPWFRPDPQALSSKSAQKEQMFRVYKKSTGRTISGGVVETLAEAEALMEEKGDDFAIKGGKYATGVTIRFKENLTEVQLEKLVKLTGYGDWTQTATNEITIINFRDDETNVPRVDDEVFLDQINKTFNQHGKKLKVDRIGLLYTEGEYGYEHNWQDSPQGQELLNRGTLGGRSDLHAWIRDRRSEFENILEDYSGENLKLREEEQKLEKTYNQQQRGSIQFRSSETIISLFEGADRSTFLHEKDWQTTLDYLGVKSGDEIGVEQHEKWAESFEKYLFEGKAPSLELQSVFGRFKRWMMSVYKQLKNLDVEINDEIRGVFDRMLATPDEIENAENVSRLIPMFENIEQSGMTPSEWNNYQSTANAATRQAEDDLDRKKFKEEDNERKKWYREELAKTKEQVEAEVNEMPVYQAIHFLQFGEVLTGELLPGAEPMKLDKKALIEEFGQITNQLPRGRKIHANKDGVHHDMAAEIFGFASGQEMITQIMNAKPRKAFIDQVAKERMMAAYRDMRVDMTKLEEEAIKSAHMADQRSRFLHLELKALAKRASIPATPAAAARETALAMISRLTIQNLHVGKYRAAELAAARAAEKAILKENWAEAVKQKRAQLLNHHLYREIEKSKEEVRKKVKYATTLDKPAAKQRLARDYIDQINTILEKLDLKQSVSKKARDRRTKFADWVEAQKNEGNELVVTEEMQKTLNSAEKTHYKDMTVAEFTEVMDTLKNIAHLAKWKQRLLDDRDKLDFDQTVDAMVDDAIDEHKQWKEQAPDFTGSKLEIFKEHWEAFSAEHDKIEYVLESMDNFKTNGIWWRNMFKPIADAADVEMEMNDKFIEQMKTIMLDRYTRKERNAWNKTVSTKKGKFNKKNIIAMALNWGNEYNRDAVIKGFEANKNWGITELDVEQILDDHMEQRDWDMVQDIWDMINELWPEVAALQKELTGVVPMKVEATPFMTKFGLIRGGYYPVSFSEKFSSQQRKRTAEQSFRELYETSPVKATTRKGSTIERTDTKDQFVRLDLDVLTEHMHDVIHDLTHRKAIMRVAKLMNHPEIQGAIEGVLGTKVYDQFEPWLKSIAAPEPNYTGRLERAANWTRHSATIVAMGFKVTTAIQQPLGYSQTGAYLGTEWASKGLKNYLKNPVKNRDLILSKSVYMRNRTKTLDRDIRDSVKRIHAGDSKLKDMQSKYFYFIGMLDMAVSLPTWQAAYEKSLWEGMSERDAKAQGDSAVRMTQGSGEMKDMANIQKGSPTFKLFTQFYSYFSAYYGAQKRNVQMYARGEITTWQAFVQFVYLTVVPAVLSQLIVGRGPDEDEDENWAWWAAKEIMQFPAMGMIGLRDVVTVLFNPQFGTALPYTDVLDGIIRGGDSVLDLLSDDEFNKTDVKNIIVALGYALKMPGRQTANIYEHLYEVLSENEDFSLFELLVKVDRND